MHRQYPLQKHHQASGFTRKKIYIRRFLGMLKCKINAMTSQALHAGRTRLFHSTISGRNTYLSVFPTFQVTLSSCPLQVANTGNVRIWFCLTIRCLLHKSRVEAGFS